MTERTLKILQETKEIRKKEALQQEEQCRKIITKAIEKIISMDSVKVTRIIHNYDNWTADVEVVDNEGERVFGADFTIYYYTGIGWRDRKGVEINYGTCGQFDKDNQPQIDKVLSMAKVLEHLDEIEKCFEELPSDRVEAFEEVSDEVRRARDELENNYTKEILTTLAEGNEYEEIKITKITPKFVTYEHTGEHRNGIVERERKEDFARWQAHKKMKELDERMGLVK